MGVTITQRPTRSNEHLTSRWTAAHNPVIYKFQRRDREISGVTVNLGQLRLTLNDASGINPGDSVYVSTTKYKSPATVEAVAVSDIWVSGITPAGNDGTGYLNLSLRNYRIQINIYEVGNNRLLGSTACVPFTNGAGTKDLAIYLAAYLKLRNTITYEAVNERDVYGSIKFYITFQEFWEGGSGEVQSDASNFIFAVNAARQIGDKYGQNLSEFVVMAPTTRKAKFLTKFKRPVYFEGQPFAIGFIYSELTSLQLNKNEVRLNANMQQVSEQSTELNPDGREAVNALTLDGGYSSTVKYVRLKLTSGVPVTEAYVYPGYVEDGYVAKL